MSALPEYSDADIRRRCPSQPAMATPLPLTLPDMAISFDSREGRPNAADGFVHAANFCRGKPVFLRAFQRNRSANQLVRGKRLQSRSAAVFDPDQRQLSINPDISSNGGVRNYANIRMAVILFIGTTVRGLVRSRR